MERRTELPTFRPEQSSLESTQNDFLFKSADSWQFRASQRTNSFNLTESTLDTADNYNLRLKQQIMQLTQQLNSLYKLNSQEIYQMRYKNFQALTQLQQQKQIQKQKLYEKVQTIQSQSLEIKKQGNEFHQNFSKMKQVNQQQIKQIQYKIRSVKQELDYVLQLVKDVKDTKVQQLTQEISKLRYTSQKQIQTLIKQNQSELKYLSNKLYESKMLISQYQTEISGLKLRKDYLSQYFEKEHHQATLSLNRSHNQIKTQKRKLRRSQSKDHIEANFQFSDEALNKEIELQRQLRIKRHLKQRIKILEKGVFRKKGSHN